MPSRKLKKPLHSSSVKTIFKIRARIRTFLLHSLAAVDVRSCKSEQNIARDTEDTFKNQDIANLECKTCKVVFAWWSTVHVLGCKLISQDSSDT